MPRQAAALLCTLIVVLALAAPAALAQPGERTMPLRTPDGQPDISGTFTFRTLTPLERPEQFDGVERLGPEDAAAFEAAERTRRNRDLFDPEKGALFYRPRSEGGVLSYNEFWYERGVELTSDKRTSLIVDPPDGRRPPRTPEAIERRREAAAYRRAHMYDSYENRSMFDRLQLAGSGPKRQYFDLYNFRDYGITVA